MLNMKKRNVRLHKTTVKGGIVMKITDKIDVKRYAEAWRAGLAGDKSWLFDSEVSLSPGAQAQVLPEGVQSTGPMPHLSPIHGMYNAWEFGGWKQEAMSITKSGYIGDWTYLKKIHLKGPDALKCLEVSTITKYNNFQVGKGKHIITVREDGKLIGEGIAFKLAEDEYLCTGGQPVSIGCMIKPEGLDVVARDCTFEEYCYHVQGPVSLEVLEKATGEDLKDIKFTWFRYAEIAGRRVRIFRGGMSGELGYEVHGDSADGSVVWNAIVEAGKPLGLEQMGHRTMPFNHLEAFFPTCWLDYIPATFKADSQTENVLFHSPIEFGWINTIDFSRDFPGKQALLDELENPKKKSVMLVWNSEDVLKIYASLFDDEPDSIDLPPLPVKTSETHFDFAIPVLTNDYKLAGFATNRGYSPRTKKYISITHLDIEYAKEGTELLVKYGREGARQIMIRATVQNAPYKKDNRRVQLQRHS
jgi:vanillate/3-O-methylgallate O-demethylase